MLSPVTMREEEELGRLVTKNFSFFVKLKRTPSLLACNRTHLRCYACQSKNTYGAQEKLRSKKYPFHREKVKVMLLVIKVMLLAAEVMLLHAEVALLQLEVQP